MKLPDINVLFNEMVKNEIDIRIARNIRRLREERGFSRSETEEGAELSFGILAQIETLHKVAGKSIQRRIAKYLKVPLEEFYKPLKPVEKVFETEDKYGYRLSRKEREYVNKMTAILRTKDTGTVTALTKVIDIFLKVSDKI